MTDVPECVAKRTSMGEATSVDSFDQSLNVGVED